MDSFLLELWPTLWSHLTFKERRDLALCSQKLLTQSAHKDLISYFLLGRALTAEEETKSNLLNALREGHAEILQVLVTRHPKWLTKFSFNLLACTTNPLCLEYLLLQGMDALTPTDCYSTSLLHPQYEEDGYYLHYLLSLEEQIEAPYSKCTTVVHLAACDQRRYFLISSILWCAEARKGNGVRLLNHQDDSGLSVLAILERELTNSLLTFELYLQGYCETLPIQDSILNHHLRGEPYPIFTLERQDGEGRWHRLVKFHHKHLSEYYLVRGLFIALCAQEGLTIEEDLTIVEPGCFLRVTATKNLDYPGYSSPLFSVLSFYQLGYYDHHNFIMQIEEIDDQPWRSRALPGLIELPSIDDEVVYIHCSKENERYYREGVSLASRDRIDSK